MIKLYQFPAYGQLPNLSPFCMKLETYLRISQIPFEIVNVRDPRKAPKGKLPFIKDENTTIADSGLVIDYLKNKYGDVLDRNLSREQQATALAIRRLMEEHFYWTAVYVRWITPIGWSFMEPLLFKKIPQPLRCFIGKKIQKKVHHDLYCHGIGRHTAEEIYRLGIEDLQTVAQLLGDKPFFFGDEPTSIDACVHAFISSVLLVPIASPLQEYIKSQANLVSYVERILERFYRKD